jgi:maltooligosyltrehalose trehalohydrolase
MSGPHEQERTRTARARKQQRSHASIPAEGSRPTAPIAASIGAVVVGENSLFRVWAPDHARIDLVLEAPERMIAMERDADGYFSATVPAAGAGTRYRYRLGDGTIVPDPASRYQPEGPHGPSEVVDPDVFEWTDHGWKGIGRERQVIYEMHVGTFTREGTWRAAAEQLPALADLGVTILEIMPIAEFPGRFNWGYDGVAPFAPARVYGTPDDFRWFVDRAHALDLAVILDVVYNHMGPDGCYMGAFARSYFSDRYSTDWGDAINFDGPDSAPVRHFFIANVDYWIREFRLDGFRFDATQNIYDAGSPHILTELAAHARAAAGDRVIWLVGENEPQLTDLVRPQEQGGHGFDAIWNDDFHHSAMVALTGRTEAYYSDHRGSPQEFVSAAKWGFLFQGQYYHWQQQRRGTSALDVPARQFVTFLQNHDQVANSADGRRIHALASAGEYRAMTALLLLMPGTAMLFQGQEFGASGPFLFFADHEPALAERVHEGRRSFMAQFPSAGSSDVQEQLPHPADEATFRRSTLDSTERTMHEEFVALHRDLIRLSRTDPAFAAQDATRLHGAVLTDEAFALRWIEGGADDRLLLVNLGTGRHFEPAPEPLLAPPAGMRWALLWSSDDPAYGGPGVVQPEQDDGWRLPGRAAVVLAPAPREARAERTDPAEPAAPDEPAPRAERAERAEHADADARAADDSTTDTAK